MKLKDTKLQIVKNTLTGWLAMGTKMAIALVMVPFLLHHLGKDGYGLIGLIGVIIGFSSLADLGLREALGRELSEKVANKDVRGFRSLSSTALVLYVCIAVSLTAVMWVLAPWFTGFFKVDETLRSSAIWLIRLYGNCSLLLSFITPVFTAGLQSFMRFDAINFVQTVSGIAQGLLLFLCISFFDVSPLIIWALVMFSILLINLLVVYFYYKKWCFEGKIGLHYLDWSELKPLFKLGGYMYILKITNSLSERSDPLVISYYFGTAGVALYQSGAKLSQMLRPVVLTLSTQVHPLTTRYHVRDQQNKQRRTLLLGTRYTLLFGLIFSVGILLFAERFCWLWLSNTLGDDYLTVAHVMQLWAVVNVFDYAGAMHWPVLLAMKKLSFALAVQIPSGFFNILISVYLVGYTDIGIPGVLWATAAIGCIRRPIVLWYVAKLTRLPVKEYINSAYLPSIIQFALLLMFYYLMQFFPLQSWIGLISSMFSYCIYAAFILLIIEWRMLKTIFYHWRQLQYK